MNTESELMEAIERLNAADEAADEAHREATEALQLELYVIDRKRLQEPDESLDDQRREVVAKIHEANQLLESTIKANSRERSILETKIQQLTPSK